MSTGDYYLQYEDGVVRQTKVGGPFVRQEPYDMKDFQLRDVSDGIILRETVNKIFQLACQMELNN